jgi:hypothetical protein
MTLRPRSIVAFALGLALGGLWIQSYLGGFNYGHVVSRDGLLTFIITGGHGALGIPIPYALLIVAMAAFGLYGMYASGKHKQRRGFDVTP